MMYLKNIFLVSACLLPLGCSEFTSNKKTVLLEVNSLYQQELFDSGNYEPKAIEGKLSQKSKDILRDNKYTLSIHKPPLLIGQQKVIATLLLDGKAAYFVTDRGSILLHHIKSTP